MTAVTNATSSGLRGEKSAGIMGGDPNKTSNYLF